MTLFYNRKADKKKRKILRKNMTEAEQLLWGHIRKRQINGHKFRRQYSICGYVVDFYCPELRLAIELDGGYHLKKEQIINDNQRQWIIESLGIRFLRFTNDDVFADIDQVVNKVRDKIMSSLFLPLNKGKMSR